MDKRHRITFTKQVRKRFRIVEGQKFYLVSEGNDLLMKPVPDDPAKRLDELLGKDFVFDREARRNAEEWQLNETKKEHQKQERKS